MARSPKLKEASSCNPARFKDVQEMSKPHQRETKFVVPMAREERRCKGTECKEPVGQRSRKKARKCCRKAFLEYMRTIRFREREEEEAKRFSDASPVLREVIPQLQRRKRLNFCDCERMARVYPGTEWSIRFSV